MEVDDVWLLWFVQHQSDLDRQVLLNEALQQYELQLEWRRLTRPRHYLTCACLDLPLKSASAKLYRHGSDGNFINVTSLTRSVAPIVIFDTLLILALPNRQSFEDLVSIFEPHYTMSGRGVLGGRPKRLQAHQEVLGLLLYFYVTSMDQASTCIAFGVPPSTASRTVRGDETALSIAVRTCREARISWPSPKQKVTLAKLVAAREPLLQFTFGFIDG